MSSFFNQIGDLSQTFGHVVQQQVINQTIVNEELRVGSHHVIVKEKIAEGGFGLIELVVDGHSQRELVLKRCNIDRAEVREIVQKEINILQRFKGPYMVNLLDHDVNQKRTSTEALLLMEYYPGGHLLERLNNRHGSLLPIQSAYTIFGQLLQAVNALHTNRPPIIHRDLKLENILIGPDGKVRLCDFGSCMESPIMCRNMAEKEVAEASIQKETTQMYRAPEMADIYMREILTEKTDIWALGCIFYALLFLKHPFQDKGNLAIMSGNYVIPNPSPVPADAIEFLKRMLDVDPEARPSCAELISQLAEIYAGRPLPPFVLSEEALQRRKEREAKNVVRSDSRKKAAPVVPQRKGAPPSANSAAAKRLAAKKGDVLTSPAPIDSFGPSSNGGGSSFDPFAENADPHFDAQPISVLGNNSDFDPFADDSSTSTVVRQPSFSGTRSSFSSEFAPSTAPPQSSSSVASLFPSATSVQDDALFAPSTPSRSTAKSNDGFATDFATTADFDPFASSPAPPAPATPGSMRKPSFLDEYVPPSSSSKAVRKPSFGNETDFTPTKPATTKNDFSSFEPAFDPFASPARTSSSVAVSNSGFETTSSDPFAISNNSAPQPPPNPFSPTRNSFTSSSASELLDVLPPVVELVPTPAPTSNNHVNFVDDLLSNNDHKPKNNHSYGMDLLSLSEPPVLTPSKAEPARQKSVSAKTPNELLSLYDQPPPVQPQQSQSAKPIMLNNSQAPTNPFASRGPMGNTGNAISGMVMGSQQPSMGMRPMGMIQSQPPTYQQYPNGSTYMNNPASRPVIVNNPASNMNANNPPVRPNFSSYGGGMQGSNSKFISTPKKEADPFSSLNVLPK